MSTNEKASGSKRRNRARTAKLEKARTAAPGKPPAKPKFTAKARYELIEKAAYLRAEQRGFEPGHELEDWLAAEAEVQKLVPASRVRVIQERQ